MKVLGIDPAAHYTGWALIEERTLLDCGIINGFAGFKNKLARLIEWKRIQVISRAASDLVRETDPDVIGYETQTTKDYHGNAKAFGTYRCAVSAIGAAVGLTMSDRCILLAMPPWDWKQNKSKAGTMMDAQAMFNVPLDDQNPRSYDIADAMMIAYHAQTVVKLAKRFDMDIGAYCTRQCRNTQPWTRAMFAQYKRVRGR